MSNYIYPTRYVRQLSEQELALFLKTIKYTMFSDGFRQGHKILPMKDGTQAVFSYNENLNIRNFLFMHDFEVRAKNNSIQNYYGIHQLHHNRKILNQYFKFMIKKFDTYYDDAKKFWKNHADILKILEKSKTDSDLAFHDIIQK